MRIVQHFFTALAVVLAIAAGVSYWIEQPEPPAMALVSAKIDAGSLALNNTIEVAFTMTNRADVPLRIVGVLDEPC